MQEKTELIRRSVAPEALEFPLHALDGPITPNELFFVRNHFETPMIEVANWRLSIEGSVQHPLVLVLDELRDMPKVSVESMLECAGNGRASLETLVPGLQWDRGAVGNAVWSGVSVRTVLDLARITDRAVDVVFEGAYRGKIDNPAAPRDEVAYARSIPRDVALGSAILAYEMNGSPLPRAHGFPVRLIVPGWYGAASVKWVARILAIDHPFGGYYQTADYSYWQTDNGLPELRPIGPMPVKSTIARPIPGTDVSLGEQLEICGAAWTGIGEIMQVEVSLDAGATWADADLSEPRGAGAWRLWRHEWLASEPTGIRTILARARDSQGRVQAAKRNCACHSYMIDHSIPVEINVLPG